MQDSESTLGKCAYSTGVHLATLVLPRLISSSSVSGCIRQTSASSISLQNAQTRPPARELLTLPFYPRVTNFSGKKWGCRRVIWSGNNVFLTVCFFFINPSLDFRIDIFCWFFMNNIWNKYFPLNVAYPLFCIRIFRCSEKCILVFVVCWNKIISGLYYVVLRVIFKSYVGVLYVICQRMWIVCFKAFYRVTNNVPQSLLLCEGMLSAIIMETV